MDLSFTLFNKRFVNPFILSSAPPTRNGEMIKRAFKMGWGGAVTKTFSLEGVDFVRPRFGIVKSRNRNIGLTNIELISEKDALYWVKEIKDMKAQYPDRIVIASIMADLNMDSWTKLASICQDTPADIIEANVSCPHGCPEKHMGAFIGQDPNLVGEVTKAIKKGSNLPLLVKLTSGVTDMVSIGKIAVQNGADGITAINTISSIAGIDLENLAPFPSVGGYGAKGGYSGPGIKPIALGQVWELSKNLNVPISGCGGITTWQDSAEFLAVGASTIQICTAVMWHGYKIIDNLTKGLSDYLERKGFESIDKFVGVVKDKIGDYNRLVPYSSNLVADVMADKCNQCKICVTACNDGGYQAISCDDKIVFDKAKCGGCSLCMLICPQDAVRMVNL